MKTHTVQAIGLGLGLALFVGLGLVLTTGPRPAGDAPMRPPPMQAGQIDPGVMASALRLGDPPSRSVTPTHDAHAVLLLIKRQDASLFVVIPG
jgi:hypothetical protein